MPNENQTISWSAPEFRHYEKNTGWYITFGAIAVLLVLFFIIQDDIFAAVSIAIIAIFVYFFSLQKPQIVQIELTSKALRYGNISFPYKQLKYFWIVNSEHHKTLNLVSSTVINNTIIVELMDQDEDEIRQFLLQHVPEHHETTATFAQKVSHHLKF